MKPRLALLSALLALQSMPAWAMDPAIPPAPAPETMLPAHIRYWDPNFRDIRVYASYPSVILRDGQVELWNTGQTWTGPNGLDNEVDRFTRQRGAALDALPGPETVARIADLIDDVSDPADPSKPAPKRSFSRPYVMHDPETGYVGLVSVYPEWGAYLRPALIVSASGAPGTWHYLGQLTGEPAEEAAWGRIWSDGGGLIRLKDGRWRAYLNGYGIDSRALSILEADTLHGPWTFLRDQDGTPKRITPAPGPSPAVFPSLLRVSETEWHLWFSNRWIPSQIWHYVSENGLDFRPYGVQPEVERTENQPGFKGIRAYVTADGKRIVGLLPIWDSSTRPAEWRLYATSMPVGLAPVSAPSPGSAPRPPNR